MQALKAPVFYSGPENREVPYARVCRHGLLVQTLSVACLYGLYFMAAAQDDSAVLNGGNLWVTLLFIVAYFGLVFGFGGFLACAATSACLVFHFAVRSRRVPLAVAYSGTFLSSAALLFAWLLWRPQVWAVTGGIGF